MVSGKSEEGLAIGSRIRFTDAHLDNKNISLSELYLDPVVLPELGEPKPGAAEFYTLSPYKDMGKNINNKSEGYWTYDYCFDKSSYQRIWLKENLPKLRGRKYYWHSDEWKKYINKNNDHKEQPLTAMRQRIRPLKNNTKCLFKFRVYFENLSKQELKQVRWALSFNNLECAHKLGKAKPLGFGSVKLQIHQLMLRKIDEKTGAWKLEEDKKGLSEGLKPEGEAIDALSFMSNWENRPGREKFKNGQNAVLRCVIQKEKVKRIMKMLLLHISGLQQIAVT